MHEKNLTRYIPSCRFFEALKDLPNAQGKQAHAHFLRCRVCFKVSLPCAAESVGVSNIPQNSLNCPRDMPGKPK